jgi:hypothetical protein
MGKRKFTEPDYAFKAALEYHLQLSSLPKKKLVDIAGVGMRMIDYILSGGRPAGKKPASRIAAHFGYNYHVEHFF